MLANVSLTSRRRLRSLPCMSAMALAFLAMPPGATAAVVPIIDMAGLRDPDASEETKLAVARQIGEACEKIGFFVVQNHGVPAPVIADAWQITTDFFDMPVEDKLGPDSLLLMTDEYPYGYSPYGGEVLAKGKDLDAGEDAGEACDDNSTAPGDMKEMFAVGPYNEASGMPSPRYPDRPLAMQAKWTTYYQSMEDLAATIMRGFALALDLPEEWFTGKMDHHACSLRALNYPDLAGPPLPGQMRASSHTDYGVLTILKSGGPGLQVKTRDGVWHDVPFLENAYVINLGDLMSRWTNEKWTSTPHRVVNPPESPPAQGGSHRRQSMAFFANLNMDAEVSAIRTCVSADNPAKYPDTTAGEHLMAKHLASTQGILDDSWMKVAK